MEVSPVPPQVLRVASPISAGQGREHIQVEVVGATPPRPCRTAARGSRSRPRISRPRAAPSPARPPADPTRWRRRPRGGGRNGRSRRSFPRRVGAGGENRRRGATALEGRGRHHDGHGREATTPVVVRGRNDGKHSASARRAELFHARNGRDSAAAVRLPREGGHAHPPPPASCAPPPATASRKRVASTAVRGAIPPRSRGTVAPRRLQDLVVQPLRRADGEGPRIRRSPGRSAGRRGRVSPDVFFAVAGGGRSRTRRSDEQVAMRTTARREEQGVALVGALDGHHPHLHDRRCR